MSQHRAVGSNESVEEGYYFLLYISLEGRLLISLYSTLVGVVFFLVPKIFPSDGVILNHCIRYVLHAVICEPI